MLQSSQRISLALSSASSFPRREKCSPPLSRGRDFLKFLASVNVALCRAITLTCHPHATRSDRIAGRSAACELGFICLPDTSVCTRFGVKMKNENKAEECSWIAKSTSVIDTSWMQNGNEVGMNTVETRIFSSRYFFPPYVKKKRYDV